MIRLHHRRTISLPTLPSEDQVGRFLKAPQPWIIDIEGSAQLLPVTLSLFKAFENADPAPQTQRAITLKLLRGMYMAFEVTHNTPPAIAADLAIVGLFFAMRSCENTATPQPGRTKTVDMKGIYNSQADN